MLGVTPQALSRPWASPPSRLRPPPLAAPRRKSYAGKRQCHSALLPFGGLMIYATLEVYPSTVSAADVDRFGQRPGHSPLDSRVGPGLGRERGAQQSDHRSA